MAIRMSLNHFDGTRQIPPITHPSLNPAFQHARLPILIIIPSHLISVQPFQAFQTPNSKCQIPRRITVCPPTRNICTPITPNGHPPALPQPSLPHSRLAAPSQHPPYPHVKAALAPASPRPSAGRPVSRIDVCATARYLFGPDRGHDPDATGGMLISYEILHTN